MAERSKGQPLRNSTGKLKGTAQEVDKGPNYLRASSGSCHDFCKYGTPHEFKVKPKLPVRRRSTPNSEVTVEIFVPSDRRSVKAVKPSSVVPDPSKSTKIEVAVSGKTARSVRQQVPSSDVKTLSDLANQDFSVDVTPLSPDSSTLIKQQESSSNSMKQESSPDVISELAESSKSAKQESSLEVKSSSPDSSISAKQKSPPFVKSSPTDSSISVKQESSSDVKSSSHASLKKGSLSQISLTNASKSTSQDVQSSRRSSFSNVKPLRSPHLMSGSISKASAVGRRSSLPDDKAPLKNVTSTKVSTSLKSKSNRARTEQSSSPNLLVRKGGNGLSGKRDAESKMDSSSRTSKAASKKKTSSPPTTLSLNTRKNLKTAAENSLTSSTTIALTPNLPGTKVARLNVRKNKERSGNTEATTEESNGNSASKEPKNHEKIPEKTLHMIEAASNQQSPIPDDDNRTDISQSHLQVSPASIDSLCQSKSPFSSQDAVETDESESEYSESEADDDSISRSGKGRVLDHEGNESGPVKLKFRRGKVVDLESVAKSPRKLRFRRRKSVGKDQCKCDGVKVVLRHQDLQEKKCEKGLLNVVIEETASKLVETRKSKVKALVGAFETVISLQESKSSGERLSPYSSPGR